MLSDLRHALLPSPSPKAFRTFISALHAEASRVPRSALKIITLFVVLSGCNPADVPIYLNGRIIKAQMLDKCAADEACESAVQSQFDDCFAESGFSRLKEFGTSPKDAEAQMDNAIRYTYACIIDEAGEPLFRTTRKYEA